MLTIGLTGGIGSGKSTLAKFFASLGVDIIDTDLIAKELVTPEKPALEQILDYFGSDLLDEKGALDRMRLRKIVFENPHARNWLENLLHPLIMKEVQRRLELVHSPYCVVVIPLLVESKRHYEWVDRILVVDVPEEVQIQRTKERDKMEEAEVKAILQSQALRQERIEKADDLIINNKDMNDLQDQVKKLHQFYSELATKKNNT